MELSIIITSYRNPRLLNMCIQSIKEHVKNVEYEIIVASSATQEDTFDLMREKYPKLTFFGNKKNVGMSRVVNQGIKESKGKYLLILNDDVLIKDDCVSESLKYIKNNPKIGILGLKMVNFDNSTQQSFFRFHSPFTILYRRTLLGKFNFAKKRLKKFLLEKEQNTKKPFEPDWVMASAILVRKKATQEVGPMDEGYPLYFEDTDWCWRFWQKGYKVVYYPLVKIYHYHGKVSAVKGGVVKTVLTNRQARMHIYSGFRFLFKYWLRKNPRTGKINI